MSDQMTVAHDCVVSFHYTLTDEDGAVLDSNVETEAMTYLHGHGQLIPGLEAALEGAGAGAAVKVTLPPEEGYGVHDAERIIELPRSRFEFELEPGEFVEAQHPDGRAQAFQVVEVSSDSVTLDGNHPLAGKQLSFEVRVVGVRKATATELEHGHAH